MIRIGSGFDIHALEDGRKFVLGGVAIPADKGPRAHSDGDVLLHALTDAVLGALAWGDIGQWFPDSDDEYKDADSKEFINAVWQRAREEGWKLGNADCTVVAEQPKLAPFTGQIREVIAELFDADIDQVSLKATTSEKIGFVGREEGIVASATVLLVKN